MTQSVKDLNELRKAPTASVFRNKCSTVKDYKSQNSFHPNKPSMK